MLSFLVVAIGKEASSSSQKSFKDQYTHVIAEQLNEDLDDIENYDLVKKIRVNNLTLQTFDTFDDRSIKERKHIESFDLAEVKISVGTFTLKQQLFDFWQSSYFSKTVATNGSLLAIGAPLYKTSKSTNQGCVFIFGNSTGGWTQMQQILSTCGSSCQFGTAISFSQNVMLIGAKNYNKTSGAAFLYVFRNDKGIWSQNQWLLPEENPTNAQFGHQVAVSKDM